MINDAQKNDVDNDDAIPAYDVCVVTSAHSLTDSRIWNQEGCSMLRMGLNISMVGPEGPVPSNCPTKTFPRSKGILGRAGVWIQLLKTIRSIKAKVFHCHELDAALAAVIMKIFRGSKVVFDSHELYREMISMRFPWLFRPFVKGFIYLFEIILYSQCDALVTVTEGVADRLAEASGKSKIIVIYNASSPKLFGQRPCALPDDTGRSIMHLGNLTFLRGSRQVCEAMNIVHKHYPDSRLYLVGKMDTLSQRFIEEYRSKHGLDNVIVPVGFVPYAELGAYIPYGEFGIMGLQPNENTINALPVKMFDYMTFGLPTVASDFDEIRRLNAKYEVAVLVDTRDPQAIAEGMIRLLEDADLRKRLSENARSAVTEEYSWDHMEKRLADLYSQLLERPINV